MHKIPLNGHSKICAPSPTAEFLNSSQTCRIMGNVALSMLLDLEWLDEEYVPSKGF